MTVGDPLPEEPERSGRVYDLIYEVSDRARAMAPPIATSLRAIVLVLVLPAFLLIIAGFLPILGVGLIARGAEGWAQIILVIMVAIALAIEVLFCVRLRQYWRVVGDPNFTNEVAQLIDIAEMSDDLVGRIQGVVAGETGMKRLRSVWELWRLPNYFSDRIKSLTLVRLFVPPLINRSIQLAIAQFWAVVLMWAALVITVIMRLTGTI
ncbi:MAG TPA: hypothetical protein VK030_06300 [Actinomycetales bacterium]|nr:hypothetical protein [Actinomycetales bacterium]